MIITNPFRISIRCKILSTTIALMISLLVILTFIQIDSQTKILEHELASRVELMKKNLNERARFLADTLVIQVENALSSFDLLSIIKQTEKVVNEQDELTYIILMDQSRMAHIHTQKPELLDTLLTEPEDRFAAQQKQVVVNEFGKDNVPFLEFIEPIYVSTDLWGVLRFGYSLQPLNQVITQSKHKIRSQINAMVIQSTSLTIIFIIISSIIVTILATKLSRPLISLTRSAEELAKGNYAVAENMVVTSVDEVGILAQTFTKMSKDLHAFHNSMAENSRTLEHKVEARTADLNKTLAELTKTNQELMDSQAHLIQVEKMAALGQLIAGVAHEINTPLGTIKAAIGNITDALNDTMYELPKLFQLLDSEKQDYFFAILKQSVNGQRTITTREERSYKKAMIKILQAHDLANAQAIATRLIMMGIVDDYERFIPFFHDDNIIFILKMAYGLSRQRRNSNNVVTAVEKASKVVFALKCYARYDHSGEMVESSIKEQVDVVLTLYNNQLKHGIELARQYQDIPKITCFPDELNQVWINLIHNAIQAMGGKGNLTIAIKQEDNHIIISITDTGGGIPEEVKKRIFEPFFTTKPQGEGSGLGLDISKKIIQKHHGEISVESQPGQTIFTVLLPITNNT